MSSTRMRVPVAVMVAAMVMALIGVVIPGGAGAAARTKVQGVDKDTIEIVVLAAGLDQLRERGFNLGPQLTTDNIVRRAQGYADLYGPINGRELEFEIATWDPLDATTFDRACTEATQDHHPFMVINGNGYRADAISCITVDNEVPLFLGEAVYDDLQRASGKNLVSIALPAEVNGAAAASFVAKTKVVPKGSKIGILSSNEPQRKASADALEKRLEQRGYDIAERVEINTLQADSGAINRESSAAVETLRLAGVDVVFVAISPTTSVGFWQEWARTDPGFENFMVDTAGASCTSFAATRIPVEAAGTPCITAYDGRSEPGGTAIRKDNAFEAKCRSQYAKITGWDPYPGAQQGGTDRAGQHWDEDLPKEECTMMSVLLPAIKAAGKNPTWAKVRKNILATTNAPMAEMSGGRGGFAEDKPYMATQVHMVKFQPATADTPKDANGTYDGCPLPLSCWIPELVDGQEWYPATTAKG